MFLVDTHAHLDQEEFDGDRDAVVQAAGDAGVGVILAIGCTAESSRKCVELAAKYDCVFAAVGIQPNYVAEAKPGDWDEIVKLAGAPKVVAIGETGLDRHWDFSPIDLQQDYFDRHLRLSQEIGLPFVVHTRETDEDNLTMLTEAAARGPLSGVMHSYCSDADYAQRFIEMGLYISFAGMVTFKKSDELRAVAASIPADRILVETDSPYLSPHPMRGKRNEPARVALTAACVAEARGQTLEEFADITTANARRLFQLPSN
ncbi:MAG: TatD family hydrolase [Pirellulales bacterium]|nr:TatD family hydrolase [Pirellulales bacterium]